MSDKPSKRKPGDFEVRIAPDGRVLIAAADDAMFDLAEAIDPDHPAIARRRKARARGNARKDADERKTGEQAD